MLDPVGSTSWHNRHLACFQKLADLLNEPGGGAPTVMIVGPGAVTRLLAPLLNDAARPASRLRKWTGDLARYADQLIRRIPFVRLRSLEPPELRRTLNRPHRLIVVDLSRRVLAAVRDDLPDAVCRRIDLQTEPLPDAAEVVIAFNVVCRLRNPDAGLERVAAAVRPGGWLLIDDRSARGRLRPEWGFEAVADKTYRKVK